DAIKTSLSGRYGDMTLSRRRTALPECGVIAYDVPGTAQGNWFRSDLPLSSSNADGLLAFVFDNIDPTIPVISVGRTNNDNIPPLVAYTFTPNPSVGYVRQPFAGVQNDGHKYCYDGLVFYSGGFGLVSGRIIVEVTGAESLRIEKQASDCSGDPALWTFGPDATDYIR
ncbi:MAG TPA: hypothetical protein VEL04_03820, partial [Burkholderiales bacterium]|nr:hypothetical protein [Burkholderiales bacterium]